MVMLGVAVVNQLRVVDTLWVVHPATGVVDGGVVDHVVALVAGAEVTPEK